MQLNQLSRLDPVESFLLERIDADVIRTIQVSQYEIAYGMVAPMNFIFKCHYGEFFMAGCQ
jgi:hypothetical protein